MGVPSPDADVLIIGAGASGLAAWYELDRAGLDAICIEARDRIGGRILTVRDPFSPIAIELGAEFIHGRPPEIWDIAREASLAVYEAEGSSAHAGSEESTPDNDAVWRLMDEMQKAAGEESDISFAAFLKQTKYSDAVKTGATAFVEGFNAAHADVIGIAGLAEDGRASATVDGDRTFRILNGYESIPFHLARGISSKLRLNCVAEEIEWKKGQIAVHICSALANERQILRARKAVIAVPLGVLQAGGIRFQPEPIAALNACRHLAFGQVFRVVLRFEEAFWQRSEIFSEAGFIFSGEQVFPTWWTPLPVHAPLITGWSAGSHADPLLGCSQPEVIAQAIASLGKIVGFPAEQVKQLLRGAYFHDWHADPFARGAYSYVPAGALPFRQALTQPVENTIYFAGEATDTTGHSATVHGAIAAGKRAARQILISDR